MLASSVFLFGRFIFFFFFYSQETLFFFSFFPFVGECGRSVHLVILLCRDAVSDFSVLEPVCAYELYLLSVVGRNVLEVRRYRILKASNQPKK